MSIRKTEDMGAVQGFLYALPWACAFWVGVFWILS